jgi:putative membrane protein
MVGGVLAQMWDGDDHMGGGWWWVMGIGWLLFLAFVALMTFLLVRHLTGATRNGQRRSSAEDVLADRLARGEIDEDEFRRRRDALRG